MSQIRRAIWVLLLPLVGCAPVHQMPSEQTLIDMAKNLPTEDDIKARYSAVAGVLREMCTSDEYAAYYSKTACLAADMTPRQLKDSTHITDTEKLVMAKVLAEIKELNLETRRIMIDSQLEPYVSSANHAENVTDSMVRINQENLMKGLITWGQYNQMRVRLSNLLINTRRVRIQEAVDNPDSVVETLSP